ncbi:MAG: peptidoglycan-binding protein, partial [Acidobacteriota bacterium]
PAALMGRVYRLSGGVPRVVNLLCDRALLGTYVQGKERVDPATLAQAAREVFHLAQRRSLPRPLPALLMLALGAVLAMALYQLVPRQTGASTAPAVLAAGPVGGVPAKEAAPAGALPDTLQWPVDESRSRSKAIAYAALFRAWGGDYKGTDAKGVDACRQAEQLGLRCRSARAGLDELRKLDRPAVLLMRDDQGREFHAALLTLDDKTATFATGAGTKTVALAALAAQWTGQYTLLWRMPAEAQEYIRMGERGPAVQWLMGQLARAQGRVADSRKEPLFDEALRREVKQFQLAQGLIPDGAVGPQTAVRLAGVGDRSAPKLLRRQEGR